MRDDLATAESEMVAYFNHALDMSGQSFEFGSGNSDVELGLVHPSHRQQVKRWGEIDGLFRQLDSVLARRLADIYQPYDRHDYRSLKLLTQSGRGTYVRIALSAPGTVARFERRYPDMPSSPEYVGAWLREEATRDDHGLFKAVREECETLRIEALQAYALLMVAWRAGRERREQEALEGRIAQDKRRAA